MTSTRLAILALFAFVSSAFGQDEPPRSLDPRLKIELFAENPQIATPTGIDVDHAGRVWAIESNTHFPPEGYQGHPTDRVLVMEDTDGDHKADKITVFKDGLTHTMSIAVKPVWLDMASGGRESPESSAPKSLKEEQTRGTHVPRSPGSIVFIATRREILLCTDTDGDLKCDQTKRLVHLETTGNYPHNGLAGFAFDALGNMFFGFGENLGADYKLIGSDGTTLSGGGEGGNVYRCKPDGSKLERWATGFWNPHASCFDAFGRLFTLDNDPDSRPPCRLLHIIPGGDYGYKFRNGRKGTHPFTSWNGEIPGTLPMVSGTGEAPSGIVCYESDGFPDDYLGTLLVGSWGDHRIDKFVLKERGISFESVPQPIINGGENFRPVGLAVAPDGSVYVTDWVLKDYKLHGKGRVWRVSAKKEPERPILNASTIVRENETLDVDDLLKSSRLDVRRMAAKVLTSSIQSHGDFGFYFNDMVISKYGRRSLAEFGVAWVMRVQSGAVEPDAKLKQIIEGDPNEPADALFAIHIMQMIRRTVQKNDDPFIQSNQRRSWCEEKFTVAELVREFSNATPMTKLSTPPERQVELMELMCVQVGRHLHPQAIELVRLGLGSRGVKTRGLSVQWIGEENLKELRPEVEKVLASEPMTNDLFMACLASLSMLDGVPPAEFEKAPPVQHVLPIVKDAKRSAALRAIALRMLPPTLKELDAKLLGEMLIVKDEDSGDLRPPLAGVAAGELRREVVRTLQHSPIPERDELLRPIAADESLDANLRADAVAGLAPVDHHAKLNDATRDLLVKLVSGKDELLAVEAVRSLRGAAMAMQDQPARDPKVTEALKQLAADAKKGSGDLHPPLAEAVAFAIGQGRVGTAHQKPTVEELVGSAHPTVNAEAGRRVFFHTNGAGCFKCHTVGGRGGQVGPDLTVIARTMDRRKLAESILEPSKEISPQFTTWAVETTSGKVLTGMLLGEEVNGDLRLGDNTGKVFFVPFNEIETRQPLKASIMPEKLHEQLTPSEFLDLIAYLETLK